MVSLMKLKDLELFLEIAEKQSMARVAEDRNTSQSGISRIINAMEGRLDCPLFERTGRGVELTPYGMRFQKSASAILREYDQMLLDLQGLQGAVTEKLSLAIPLRLGQV